MKKLLTLVLVLALASGALAVMDWDKIDMDDDDYNQTEPGWTAWAHPSGWSAERTLARSKTWDASFTYGILGTWGDWTSPYTISRDTTDWGPPYPAGSYQKALSDDCVAAGLMLRLRIYDLDAGTYYLYTYHNDYHNGQDPPAQPLFDMTVMTDGLTPTPVIIGGLMGEPDTGAHGGYETVFVADGINTVEIIIYEVQDDQGGDSAATAMLNGFMLIPEPATVALLGLGALALIRRKK
jgi:hypothetical protein